MQNKDVSFIHS